MRISLYQVDAFTSCVFRGNPAAVCPLGAWLPDELMQQIAAENNLSETAFFVPLEGGYHLRWFTPRTEVDLCGHATLASAHVIAHILKPGTRAIRFHSKSGPLSVAIVGDRLQLDFPADPPVPVSDGAAVVRALGTRPEALLSGRDKYLAVLVSERAVRDASPDERALAALDRLGVIVSAPGTDCDFLSRFFAPKVGVPEDPVTGSAHCVLAPYWAARLGKTKLHARQVSARGGELSCEARGERVLIAGQAVTYMQGCITI